MTQPEPRYYKETFPVNKNVAQTHSTNPIAHVMPDPDAHPRADAKTTARMMKSSIHMFPNEKDKDTFTSPAKRSNAAQSQFATSDKLYGTDPPRPAQKKLTTVKMAELGGVDAVKPLSHSQLQSQKLTKASAAKQQAVVGCMGSAGAQDAIGGYRDNDVTANLVNGKHNNPAVMRPANNQRAAKASSNVSWNQPKGRQLTLV